MIHCERMNTMNVDVIFHGGYVITMEGPGTGVIQQGAVAVKGNKIVAAGDEKDVLKEYSAHRYINTTGKAVMPGFVDPHMHTGDAIVRSCAQDIPEDIWRIHGILPLLGLCKTEDYVIGSRVNVIEALKTGTTTFGDFYSPMSSIVKNYVDLGARACVADMINELPPDTMNMQLGELIDFDPSVGQKKLTSNIRLVEQYHQSNGGRITCRFGPHSPEYCSEELLREIKALSDRYDVGLYTHLSQSEEENLQVQMRYGCSPTDLLERLGFLSPKLVAAHLIFTTQEEKKRIAASGTHMVLCSGSNMLIGGIFPPAVEFAACGGHVALATDNVSENNVMFHEMKLASVMYKHVLQDATAMPAWKTLRMATIEGAKALQMEDQIGSLRPGKLADMIVIDLSYPQLTPIYDAPVRNLIPNLVYSARGNEVETVMIDGKIVVENHQLLTDDEHRVMQQANTAAKRISGALAKAPWAGELPLAKLTQEGYY